MNHLIQNQPNCFHLFRDNAIIIGIILHSKKVVFCEKPFARTICTKSRKGHPHTKKKNYPENYGRKGRTMSRHNTCENGGYYMQHYGRILENQYEGKILR